MTEYRAMHPVLPTLAYDDRLTLYHGGREFRIMQRAPLSRLLNG